MFLMFWRSLEFVLDSHVGYARQQQLPNCIYLKPFLHDYVFGMFVEKNVSFGLATLCGELEFVHLHHCKCMTM